MRRRWRAGALARATEDLFFCETFPGVFPFDVTEGRDEVGVTWSGERAWNVFASDLQKTFVLVRSAPSPSGARHGKEGAASKLAEECWET